MSPPAALLEAIHADPQDLSRRLAYADALIADGNPRGAFIAAQCRLAQLDTLDPDYPRLVAESQRLQAAHAEQWLASAFDLLGIADADRSQAASQWVWERGFVSRTTVACERVDRFAGPLAKLEPIDGLTILVGETIGASQRQLPEVASWRYLGVEANGWFTDYSLAMVLAWELTKVERLSLARCSVGESGCKLLANRETDLARHYDDFVAPPPLPLAQLRELDLRGCTIGDGGLAVLADAETMTALEALDLSQNRLGPDAIATLRAAPALTGLTRLSLAGNNDLGGEIARLAGWAVLKQLRRLAIPQSTSPAALAALFPDPSPQLRELVLTNNKAVGPEPLRVAACAEHYTHLDLGTAKLGDAGLATLLAAPSVATVTALELNGCSLSHKAVRALVDSKLERLNRLDLSSNKLTNASLELLADWPGLRHVSSLRIGNNRKLDVDGYQALADSPYFDPAELLVGKLAEPKALALLQARYGARLRFE